MHASHVLTCFACMQALLYKYLTSFVLLLSLISMLQYFMLSAKLAIITETLRSVLSELPSFLFLAGMFFLFFSIIGEAT